MPTFFHGWRRKTGVVTLVMACVFMGGWIRSESKVDVIMVRLSNREQMFISTGSSVYWQEWGVSSENAARPLIQWDTHNAMFFSSSGVEIWEIRYWYVVVPLTAVSLYLLLSKPRIAPKPKADSLS